MGNGINRFVLLVAVIAGFGGFLFGFDSSVVADIQDQVTQQLSLTTWQWSQVVSFSLLGSIAGIPLSGLIADRISRRTLLRLVALGFIIGTGLCAQSTTLSVLLVGRLIIGVCIGIASYAAPLFIAEIAPPSNRGSLVLINGLAITFGQAMAYLIGYYVHDLAANSWRWLLWLGVIPALILFLGMFLVPHSPRWLMKKQGKEQALRVLKKIRSSHAAIEQELDEIETTLAKSRGSKRLLLKPPVIYVLLAGISLGVFQQFSGINAIMFYGPLIFQSAGFATVKNSILATFWISLINFIFTAVTLYTVDRFGRRALLSYGSLLAAFSLLAVNLVFHFDSQSQKMWMLLAMTLYVIGYCVSIGSLFWVLIAEIYPIKVRGLAMSIATLMQWVANFVVSIAFLEVYNALGETIVFSLFALICIAAFVVTHYFIPETTGVSLEKIEANLAAGKKIRDIGQPLTKSKTNQSFALIMEKT